MTDQHLPEQELIRATVLRSEASEHHVETTTVHITVAASVFDATGICGDDRGNPDWRNALCVEDPRTVLPKWAMYQLACALAEALADRPRSGNVLFYEIRTLTLVTADDREHALLAGLATCARDRLGPDAHVTSLTDLTTRT